MVFIISKIKYLYVDYYTGVLRLIDLPALQSPKHFAVKMTPDLTAPDQQIAPCVAAAAPRLHPGVRPEERGDGMWTNWRGGVGGVGEVSLTLSNASVAPNAN